MNKKEFQAKSIEDAAIVKAVQETHPNSSRQEIIARFPELPAKVTTAKLRQAALKGIIIGCASDSFAQGKNGCVEPYRVNEAVA